MQVRTAVDEKDRNPCCQREQRHREDDNSYFMYNTSGCEDYKNIFLFRTLLIVLNSRLGKSFFFWALFGFMLFCAIYIRNKNTCINNCVIQLLLTKRPSKVSIILGCNNCKNTCSLCHFLCSSWYKMILCSCHITLSGPPNVKKQRVFPETAFCEGTFICFTCCFESLTLAFSESYF